MDAPQTRYALRDGNHIGYQVWGDGPIDVLEFNHGLMISIDETVDEPNWLRYEESLAGFCRLIRFDALGLGLSDPFAAGVAPSIEGWARDALAVLADAGSERAVVLASSGGALPAVWLAAHHPERVASLVLINGTARVLQADDYPIGVPGDVITDIPLNIESPQVGEDVPMDIAIYVPSLSHRVGFREWWGRAARRGASPATAIAWNLVTFGADMRADLPQIACPTLVISATEAFADLVEHGRYLSESIPGARFVTYPGRDMLPWAGEFESIVDEIEEFVTGSRRGHSAERALATVLFTDIVDSTVRAAAAGDRQWRGVLDEYDVNVGRLLARFDGVLVKNTGDGTLARFASPAQGIRCALAMVEVANRFGVAIRAGLHAGEIELRGDDIGGLAVHIASRVSALAAASEVLTTGTVRDLVVGSGIVFDDRGRHNLKGVPDEWQLLSVERA
ncbi:MAG TPA: adenylate/guanylate cyclase domain-containing protein [Acidimicrobiales bacterium]|jgi:pimeloyl-ACP methyl ester carboxylesterase|nr:adenylate/guanylate cyclase domain-containing protein [Acidimicrobiales bacterium]